MNLLFLRGLVREQRYWGDFPDRLRQCAPQLNLFFLDLPGVGTEWRRESPESISAIRIDVAKRFHEKVAQGKFPKGPWSLFSISMGGMIALDWADAEPDLFERLLIVNSSSADVAGHHERFKIALLPKIFRALILFRPVFTEKLILEITSNRFKNGDLKTQALIEKQVKWSEECPFTRTTFYRQITSATRFRLPKRRPTPKTLVISSAQDRLVDPNCSVRIAEKLGAPLVTHPWAGHDLPLDDPEWLAKETKNWMESYS